MTHQIPTAAVEKFRLPALPYGYDALAPAISEETLRFHHDKHQAAYVAKVNELTAGTPYESMTLEEIVCNSDGTLYNNAAQAWNHHFYFEALSPDAQHTPDGPFAEAVDASFGSFEAMKAALTKACTDLFGSGWVWLAADGQGRLSILSEQNAGNPLCYAGMRPLLGIDVWEHAYYIDYRNRRADSIAALWNIIDWRKVGERFSKK